MLSTNGWLENCIWEHSETLRSLYRARCRAEIAEMDSAAQAADILKQHLSPKDSVLDAGCGSGYFFHSLAQRNLDCEYYGIDGAPSLIQIGREEMPRFGLAADRLQTIRIEDLSTQVDHVICLNVLSNVDNYHRPLERLLRSARKTVVLRESSSSLPTSYQYVTDRFLDPGVELKVHVNHYNSIELMEFIRAYNFSVTQIEDLRTRGNPEDVIGYPHYWSFFLAVKNPD